MNTGLLKYLFFALALIYFILPYDLVPDFLGLLGRIEDVLILVFVLYRYFRKPPLEYETADDSGRAESAGGSTQGAQSGERNRASDFDPYEILGVDASASKEEIAAAFRREAAKYHPDKVNHLGEDLQKVAHERMLAIQKAYDALKE